MVLCTVCILISFFFAHSFSFPELILFVPNFCVVLKSRAHNLFLNPCSTTLHLYSTSGAFKLAALMEVKLCFYIISMHHTAKCSMLRLLQILNSTI